MTGKIRHIIKIKLYGNACSSSVSGARPALKSGGTQWQTVSFYFTEVFLLSAAETLSSKLTIKDTKKIADAEVPDKIMVQLLPKNPADAAKMRRGDYTGFYEALDAAHLWLTDVLFG